MRSAFLIKKYYTTVLSKVLKPTKYTKIKRVYVHINVLTFTSQKGIFSDITYLWVLTYQIASFKQFRNPSPTAKRTTKNAKQIRVNKLRSEG